MSFIYYDEYIVSCAELCQHAYTPFQSFCFAGHLGMTEDKPFMQRADWMDGDRCKYKVYCPVQPAVASNRLAGGPSQRRRSADTDTGGTQEDCDQVSALELQFDWELHQMTGYMRRLDGEYGVTKKGNMRFMDPLAPDGMRKWAHDGSQTALFGYWAYLAWYNVFVPVLSKVYGQVVNADDDESLDLLLGLKVMM